MKEQVLMVYAHSRRQLESFTHGHHGSAWKRRAWEPGDALSQLAEEGGKEQQPFFLPRGIEAPQGISSC